MVCIGSMNEKNRKYTVLREIQFFAHELDINQLIVLQKYIADLIGEKSTELFRSAINSSMNPQDTLKRYMQSK